jgi:hypothetical protein
MKNLFITLCLVLTSLTLTAQEAFNGMWINSGSDYIKTILASEYKVLRVYNTSFDEYRVIGETIQSERKNEFYTRLYNQENGYKVTIRYKQKSADTIVAVYSGHINQTHTLTRLY